MAVVQVSHPTQRRLLVSVLAAIVPVLHEHGTSPCDEGLVWISAVPAILHESV